MPTGLKQEADQLSAEDFPPVPLMASGSRKINLEW